MTAMGLPFVRSMYLDPYTYDPNRLGTASISGNYTEAEWKSYWNTTLARLQQEHVDAVYFMPGLNYIKSDRLNDGADYRTSWDFLRWTINRTHEIVVDSTTGRKMKFLFWVNINKDAYYDFTPAMGDATIVKLRTTPNAGSSTYVGEFRQDYAYKEVRDRHIIEIKWAIQNYDLDGIQYEEPVLDWGRDPSYSAPVIARYIQLHGMNPLSVYEDQTVRNRMYEIHEEFLTEYITELKNTITNATTKTFPEFVIGINSTGTGVASAYWNNGLNWTDWGNKGLIDYYISQFSGKEVDYYNNGIAGLLASCPNIACGASVHMNFSYDRELLVRDEILRMMDLGCAQQGGIFDFHFIDVVVNGISWHQFLAQNPPPQPTYPLTYTPTPTPPITPTSTPPPLPTPVIGILIQNLDFESGTSSWWVDPPANVTLSTVSPGYKGDYAAKLNISNGTNVQLLQPGITLEPDTRYRLTFAAYSTTGHDIAVRLLKHVSPYTIYGLNTTFNLSTGWQVFTVEFTTTGFTSKVNDGRLQFWLDPFAAAGDIYYIDDVKLKIVPAIPEEVKYSITIESVPPGALIKVDGVAKTTSVYSVGGLNIIEQILRDM